MRYRYTPGPCRPVLDVRLIGSCSRQTPGLDEGQVYSKRVCLQEHIVRCAFDAAALKEFCHFLKSDIANFPVTSTVQRLPSRSPVHDLAKVPADRIVS